MMTLSERAAAAERLIKRLEKKQADKPTKTRAAQLEKIKYNLSTKYCELIEQLSNEHKSENKKQIQKAFTRAQELGHPITVEYIRA